MRRLLLVIGLALACSGCAAYGPNDYDGYGYQYGSYNPPDYQFGYSTYGYPSYGYSAPSYSGYVSGPGFSFGISGNRAIQ